MFRSKLKLTSVHSRGRIIGKDAKKLKDLQIVSSAAVEVHGDEVHISADKEDSVKLAELMIKKAIKHLEAAKETPKIETPKNVVKADIMMAVYYTKEPCC